MSNRYDAFEERLVNLEDKLVALQEQVKEIYTDLAHFMNLTEIKYASQKAYSYNIF